MSIAGISRTGNSRNNFLYGTQGFDTLDGGVGNDYLRGYGGDDTLTGGTGADRFVFERTFAANGTDRITDFEVGVDILDFSLVGFSRGVLNSQPLSNVVRVVYGLDGRAHLFLDLNGGGDSFEHWASLNHVTPASAVPLSFALGASSYMLDAPLQIESVAVSGPNQLSVTTDQDAVAGLFNQSTGILIPGTSVGLNASEPGSFSVAAQGSVTAAEIRATKGTTTVVSSSLVFLGTDGADSISGSHGDDMIFGFAGSDTFLASDGLDTYADFASHADIFATDFLPTAGTFNFQYEAKGTGGVVQQAGKGVMNFIGDYAGVDFTDMAQVLLASMPSGGFYSPSNQGLQILLLIHDVPRGNSYLYEARDTQANLVINASDSIELVGIFKGALLAQGDITGV